MSKHRRPAHGSRRTGLAAAALGVAVLTTLGASAPAMAAKGGGGGKPSGGSTSSSASLKLVLLDSTDGVAHHGQRVTFDVATGATAQPHVSVSCSQSGAVVYTGQTGYYASYPWPWTQTFTLTSGAWSAGAASCRATLYWFSGSKTVTGAVLDFPVSA